MPASSCLITGYGARSGGPDGDFSKPSTDHQPFLSNNLSGAALPFAAICAIGVWIWGARADKG